jgi:hypothetical protein
MLEARYRHHQVLLTAARKHSGLPLPATSVHPLIPARAATGTLPSPPISNDVPSDPSLAPETLADATTQVRSTDE